MDIRTRRIIAASLAAAALAAGCKGTSPEQRLERASDAIVKGRYADAEKQYQALIRDYPGNDQDSVRFRRKALYRMGRLQYLFMNQPEQAIESLRQCININPRGPLSFNALALTGRIEQDTLRDYGQAVLAYQTLVAYFPKHKHTDRYRKRLVETYFRMGNMSQARSEGMAAVLAAPASRYADDIMYLVAEAAISGQDTKAAAGAFETIISRWPDSEWATQSHYELAEILEARGDREGALKHFEAAASKMRFSATLNSRIESLKREVAR